MPEFFKPTFFKINLALVSLTLVGYLIWPVLNSFTGADTLTFGLPVATRSVVLGSGVPEDLSDFSIPAVLINVIFWYALSCLYVDRFGEWEFGSKDQKDA